MEVEKDEFIDISKASLDDNIQVLDAVIGNRIQVVNRGSIQTVERQHNILHYRK